MTAQPNVGSPIADTAVAVDLVILTVHGPTFEVLLIRRAIPPFRGRWALPGGFALRNEDLVIAAERELAEETGILRPAGHLEQLATYGAPHRDPRGRVVSVAYLALLPDLPAPCAATDAAEARWVPVNAAPQLAFDHNVIVGDGIERAQSKLEYTTLATSFISDTFTLAALRHVYETVWATSLDPANFRRKVLGSRGFVVATSRSTRPTAAGRPATLYRAGTAKTLHPPILRPTKP